MVPYLLYWTGGLLWNGVIQVCAVLKVYLGSGSADGPRAVHSRLVEGLGFEEGPFWLVATRLMMGQGSGTVTNNSVSPNGDLVHRPCRQVCSWK